MIPDLEGARCHIMLATSIDLAKQFLHSRTRSNMEITILGSKDWEASGDTQPSTMHNGPLLIGLKPRLVLVTSLDSCGT